MNLRIASLLRVGLLLLLAQTAQAATVTLAWDPNPEATVTGYRLQYGTQSAVYQVQVDAGNVTSLTVDGLLDTATYYFVVQAYTADGTLSPVSAEVHTAIITPPPVPQPGVAQFTTVLGADGRLATNRLAWGAVATAQAYYLYVGTAAGLKDVVNTGETLATSVTLPALAATPTYVARLYTKQANVWRFVDLPFQAAAGPTAARLLAPAAGQTNVTAAQGFQWTAVPDAQAYYLYVGTAAGLKDVVNTGETLRTAWTAPALPVATRLFATLWTKLAGTWIPTTTTFDTAATARFAYPLQGADDVSAKETFTWSGVTGAQAYRLLVGSTPDGSDLLDSGETLALSFPVTGLTPGLVRYARLGTKRLGVWTVDAISFTTAQSARFTRPLSGDGNDLGQGLGWTPILGAEAYGLAIGTTLGGNDLFATAGILGDETSFATPALPARQPLFLRVGTKIDGVWRERTTTVTLNGAALITPTTTVAAAGQAFTWTPITNAEAYYLGIGTTPGAKDLVNTGELQATSCHVPALPVGRTLYVSLWTKANGVWNVTTSTLTAK